MEEYKSGKLSKKTYVGICSPAPPYIVNMIYCCRITLSAKPAIYDQNGAYNTTEN